MNRLFGLLVVLMLIAASSCRTPNLETPEAPFMIKGYLFGGESVHDIYVERVAISREFESETNIPVTEANLKLIHGEEEIELFPNPERPGYFYNHDYIVEANSYYSLEVEIENSSIKADCFVPDEIFIDDKENLNQITLIVGGSEDATIPIIDITWSMLEGGEYLVDLKPEEEDLVMLTFSDEDELGKFEDFFSLPIKDNSAALYSQDFLYAGRHTLTIYSISPEYSDFVRYTPTSFDRSVYRAPDNVQGAYGVFAGLTGTTFELFIEESE